MYFPFLVFFLGIFVVLAIVGFQAFASDRGWVIRWWHWILLAIWTLGVYYDLLWLGTSLGEREPKAAWFGFFAGAVILTLLGLGLYRLIARPVGKSAGEEKGVPTPS